jgi:DNA segregation ATPase FtsK/SpoIIIE, S-DNA-T family
VLVVDEARFLIAEVPDFLEQLTDITARGRSLGVHLVLATQRPAGVISEDIRTNMALRVCFRVEDAADSTAVVEFPDAAAIDRRFRGRGYARTERGAATLFQGAYVSGRRPGPSAGLVAPAQALTVVEHPFTKLGAPAAGDSADGRADADQTDLAALIAAVGETKQQAPEHRPWLPPLPPLIAADDLPFPPAARPPGLPLVGYGLEDRPVEQVQRVAPLDLDHGGHLLVVGAPQSGRTTLLRTIAAGIARAHSPADVHLYVLDCDAGGLAPLARLPHCGAVVRRTERERVSRLLARLEAEIARRHEVLSGSGFASVTEQRAATAGPGRLPYLVLLLDRWEGFVAELGQVDSGRLPDQVYRLLSEGASAGLRVIATGDKTALSRLAGQFPARLVLRMTDENDLILAGVPKKTMPQGAPPGRGITVPGGTEVQVAFIGRDPDGGAQAAALDALIRSAAALSPGDTRPLRVDVLPARLSYAQAGELPGAAGGPLQPLVAVGGDDLSRLGADLARFPGFAIAGPPLSGRSTALLVMAESLLAAGTSVIGFAPRESPLRGLAGRRGVTAVFTSADDADPVEVQRLLEAAAGPLAVLVDDAEALHQTPVGELLAQVPVEGRTRGHALVVAGTSGELVRTARSFTAAARQFRCGLLLTPEAYQLGQELFGTMLPRSAVFDRPAGRGYLIRAGQAILVQVPDLTAG